MPRSARISATGIAGGPGGTSNSITLGMTLAVSPLRDARSRACTELITTWWMAGWLGGKAAASTSGTQLTRKRWRSQAKSWWWAIVGIPVSATSSEIARPRGRLSGMELAFSITRSSISNRATKARSSPLRCSRRAWMRSVMAAGRADGDLEDRSCPTGPPGAAAAAVSAGIGELVERGDVRDAGRRPAGPRGSGPRGGRTRRRSRSRCGRAAPGPSPTSRSPATRRPCPRTGWTRSRSAGIGAVRRRAGAWWTSSWPAFPRAGRTGRALGPGRGQHAPPGLPMSMWRPGDGHRHGASGARPGQAAVAYRGGQPPSRPSRNDARIAQPRTLPDVIEDCSPLEGPGADETHRRS